MTVGFSTENIEKTKLKDGLPHQAKSKPEIIIGGFDLKNGLGKDKFPLKNAQPPVDNQKALIKFTQDVHVQLAV